MSWVDPASVRLKIENAFDSAARCHMCSYNWCILYTLSKVTVAYNKMFIVHHLQPLLLICLDFKELEWLLLIFYTLNNKLHQRTVTICNASHFHGTGCSSNLNNSFNQNDYLLVALNISSVLINIIQIHSLLIILRNSIARMISSFDAATRLSMINSLHCSQTECTYPFVYTRLCAQIHLNLLEFHHSTELSLHLKCLNYVSASYKSPTIWTMKSGSVLWPHSLHQNASGGIQLSYRPKSAIQNETAAGRMYEPKF